MPLGADVMIGGVYRIGRAAMDPNAAIARISAHGSNPATGAA